MGTRKPSKRLRQLARWHRWVGLAAAVFLIGIALTGMLINHGDALEIDKNYLRSPAILDWYGIPIQKAENGFRTGERWVSQAGNRLYVDGRELARSDARLNGAVQFQQVIVLATDNQLYLLDAQGELLETLAAEHGCPSDIQALGVHGDALLLRTRSGVVQADLNALAWQAKKISGVQWSQPETLPPELGLAIAADVRSTSLSWERVIRDIHSGRILGTFGVWMLDVLALVLVLLSVTGIWIWWRARKEFPNKDKAHRRI